MGKVMLCEICMRNKVADKLNNVKVGSGFYRACDECKQDLLWTKTTMAISADWLVKRLPNKYIKVSRTAVTPI